MALGPLSRRFYALAAFVAFACAFATTPIVARGAGSFATPLERPRPPISSATHRIAVVPRRDPFVGTSGAEAPRSVAPTTISPIPAMPGTIGPLPPNAGAAGMTLVPSGTSRVTALVTGMHPFALVNDGTTTRIVTAGDALEDSRVTEIRDDGVHLANGVTLGLAPSPAAAAAPPPVPTPAVPVTIPIQESHT